MKNEEIHNGLDKKEIRDFLSQWKRREGLIGRASEIGFIESEIKELQERLIHCKNHLGITSLIESNGWKEFDVSDDVPYDKDTYFSFLGTEEEFKKFCDKIIQEQLDS